MKKNFTISLTFLFLTVLLLSNKTLTNKVSSKGMSSSLESEKQAEEFVENFQKELRENAGMIKWPSRNDNNLKSWAIEYKNLETIERELKKVCPNVNNHSIHIYPVINDIGNISFMIVGGYKDAEGKTYLLRSIKDTSNGKNVVAPMYEWLDPCPPFDCPENSFGSYNSIKIAKTN